MIKNGNSQVVIATMTPLPNKTDEILQVLRESVPAIREQSGCKSYRPYIADNGQLVIVEKWASQADLERHQLGEPMNDFVEKLTPLTGDDTRVLELTDALTGTH